MKEVFIITHNSMGEVWINGREIDKYKYKPHLALEEYLNRFGSKLLCATQGSPEYGTVITWTIVIKN